MNKQPLYLCPDHRPHNSHRWGVDNLLCPGKRERTRAVEFDEKPSILCGSLEMHQSHIWRMRPGVDVRCPGITLSEEIHYRQQANDPRHDAGEENARAIAEEFAANHNRREQFKQEVGNFFSRCREKLSHAGHAWFADPKRPSQEFWCNGEELIDMDAADEATSKRSEIVKWADEAMFKAEPIRPEDGPQVYLLWMTPDPLGAIAAACKMYKGEVVRDLSEVTDEERLEYFQQVQKTKLKAPFEFVQFHFMVEGVTRSFTHQMVRQRTAAYAQESLRFAVKEDMPVALPPSLAGTDEYWDKMANPPETNEERMRVIWEETVDAIQARYDKLIELGMPAEDARGLLPHNVMTRLHYTTNLRALLDHAGNRLCTQAQFEWRLVFAKIMEAIRNKAVGPMTSAESFGPGQCNGMDSVYMANELLDAFKPVCFQTGRCEFKANFDRHCNIRERVDANEQLGRPSSEWDKDLIPASEDAPANILAIKPGEWLLDPGAARKRQR